MTEAETKTDISIITVFEILGIVKPKVNLTTSALKLVKIIFFLLFFFLDKTLLCNLNWP